MRRVATLLLLLALAAPGRAEASEHRVLLRRAEVAERALGDLDTAARLYREAAAAADAPADRARAEIRAARCLAQSGKPDEAMKLARPWLTPPESEPVPDEIVALARAMVSELGAAVPPAAETPVAPTGSAADTKRVAELERENEQLLIRLEQTKKGAREDLERLANEKRAIDQEMAQLRERLPPPDLDADALLEFLKGERAAERRRAQRDSRMWEGLARQYHHSGRFAEARAALRDALQADPYNHEAKALLKRLAAPLGDREQLYLRVQEVLAQAREVRAARVTAEAEALVHRARRELDAGRPSAAAPLFETALALVDSADAARRVPARLRTEVLRGLRSTEAAGVARAPRTAPPSTPLGERWSEALLALLQESGAEVAGGLSMRFHDLEPALPATARTLPPVPVTAPPAGWTLRSADVAPAPLVAAWLAGGERAALASSDAEVDLVGGTLVIVAPDDVHDRVTSRLSRAVVAGPRAAEIEIVLLRETPGALLSRLRSRGLAPFDLDDGGRGAVLPPPEVAALLAPGAEWSAEVLARATFRAAHLTPFQLTRRDGDRVLSIDVLPVSGAAAGVAVAIATTWQPAAGCVPLTAAVRAGGSLARGGALVVSGLPDPADPSKSLTALVRVGREAGLAPLPAPEAPEAGVPEVSAGLRVAEHLVPHVIASVEDTGELPLPAAGDPFPSRERALRERLIAVATGALSVELRGDRVLIVGPEAAHEAVAALLGRLGAMRGLQTLKVEMHSLAAADAGKLVELVPSLARRGDDEGGGVAQTLVTERTVQGRVSWLLTSRGRRVPLLQHDLAAPATGRDHVAHVVRSPYRSDLGAVPGDPDAWGRGESGMVETGVALAIRPFGRTDRARAAVDVHLRVVGLRAAGEHDRDTSLGDVPLLAPTVDGFAVTIPAEIGPRDVLLLTTPHDPFGTGEDGAVLLIVLRRGP